MPRRSRPQRVHAAEPERAWCCVARARGHGLNSVRAASTANTYIYKATEVEPEALSDVHIGQKLAPAQVDTVCAVVRDYADMLTYMYELKHATIGEISLPTGDANPVFIRQYPLSRLEQKQQRDAVARMVEVT